MLAHDPDYAILGAIAQLGERLLCKQEVVGSIPSSSTIYGKSKGNLKNGCSKKKDYPIQTRDAPRA